ncbi:MAG TPA: 1-acyl-sn-glycerol-3-phosphate acyltransferase, partial [Kandleria vitulina]|nr:1-acyl-sn-glycerol-3-phosphate acyltransferase [Kandleria vitulina]
IDAKAPIVPCAMINCFKVLDYNSLKKVNCAIHFFEPVTYD